MVKVEKYMTTEVLAIAPEDSIQTARNIMLRKGISRLIVVEDNIPTGIITKKDIARRLAQARAPWQRRPLDKISISRIMSSNLKTLPPDASLQKTSKLMLKENISSVPIVEEDGKLAGIITSTDLIKAFIENLEGVYKNRDLMTEEVITANRYHSIYHIVSLMEENNISRVIITDSKIPIGMVTVTDLSFLELNEPVRGIKTKEIMYVRKPQRDLRASYRYVLHSLLTAEDVMTENLITTTEDEDCSRSASQMLENDFSSLPVVREEELVGIITKKDIIKGIAMR